MSNGDEWEKVGAKPTDDEWEKVATAAPTRRPGEARQLSETEVDKFQPKTAFERMRTEGDNRGVWAGAESAARSMAPRSIADVAKLGSMFVPSLAPIVATEMAKEGIRRSSRPMPKGSGIGYRAANAVSPLIPGLNPESQEARAERADTGGILGEAAVPAALASAPLAVEGAGKLGGAVKPRLAAAARLEPTELAPRGELKPWAQRTAKLGGAGLGFVGGYGLSGELGHPSPWAGIAGAGYGAKLGTGLADFVLPAREAAPVYPGASMPLASEFYEKLGTDLARRGKEQAAIDRPIQREAVKSEAVARKPVSVTQSPGPYRGPSSVPRDLPPGKPTPFAGGTSSAAPGGTADLPPVPQGSPPPFPTIMPKERLGGAAAPEGIRESAAGTRSLVLTPQEAATEAWMQGIAKRRASERGMQFAGGMTPREGRSVPRYPTRSINEEYPGPRSDEAFGTETPPQDTPLPSTGEPQPPAPFGANRRTSSAGEPPSGVERRTAGVADWKAALETTPPGERTPGEELESSMRSARAGAPSGASEGEALRRIMRDPAEYEKYRAADQKTRDRMLVAASRIFGTKE